MDHFGFKRRKDRLNWRMLSGIHVDSIIREVDIAALQEIIDNVAYCDIESEDLRQIDPNMIKLFQLSQLIIEYLLYSQDYLSHSYQTASEELKQVTESNTELQGTLNTVMGELDAAKRDNKTLKKGLFAYQVAAKLPQKSSHQNVAGHSSSKIVAAPDKSQPNEAKQVIRIIEKQTSTSGLKEVEDSVKTADIVKDSVLPVIDEKISGIILQLKADMTNREKDIRKQFDEQLISELEAQKSAVHAEISQERAILQEEQNQVHALFWKLESAKAQPRSYLGNLEDEDDSAEMQTEQKINTLQIQQEIEGMVRQSQDETRLEAHEILTQFKQTQMNFLELLGEKFEGELQEMKQSLQIVQVERDRKDLNEKIANTTSQLLMLQDIMLNTRKEDQKDSKPVAENAVRELLRSSTTSQIVKYDNLEQKPRTSISEARKLSIKEMVDQIAVQSSQPTLQVSTAVPDVLAFFKDHIYSPGPLNPWVKSVFPHSIEEINEERALIEHKVQADMNLWDVTPESTGHTWGNDPSVAIEYEKKQITLKLEVSQKCQRDEDYARAYQYMEQELDVFVKAIFDRKLPPPIVTERRESNSSVDTPISTGTNRISLDKQVQFQNSGAIDEQIQQTFKRQTFSSLEVKVFLDPKKISKMLEVTLESNKPQNEHSKKHLSW
ncbi:Iguana/Dzip1-like DAZ-interacting protein N-terminal-domain-containing protein [Cladochytrium replicatum]|nr:Iguana/Dzip1-like DAZ-interacting protein N-terminal-domain-containing protein [Cladochytrium replicatum]